MRTTRLAITALLAVLCATFAASTAAAGAEPSSEAYGVEISLRSSTDPRNVLSVEVYPAEGVAVARTFYEGAHKSTSGAAYAIAVPAGPFDGSLDLDFPGLGTIVGTVTPTKSRGPAAEARLCEQDYPSEGAAFEGRISFHGAGDPRSWTATKVKEVSISPACGARLERQNGPATLFRRANERGPGFMGDFISFFAHAETGKREVDFAAVGSRFDNRGTVLAFDTEWLPGKIATQRWVESYVASFEHVLRFARGDSDPSRVTVTPPAPFFGRGTYLKRTGKLTGGLGVHFPGLKLRLAHPAAEVSFEDEEPDAAPKAILEDEDPD